MNYLRHGTAVTVMLGQFVDDTDGKTPETALTLTVKVSKNGGTKAARNSTDAISHDSDGDYSVPLDATDVGTKGRLRVSGTATGALACWADFFVLDADVYDAWIATGTLTVTTDSPSREASKADVSSLATSTDLATVDTVVDAIKTKTDNLPSDPATVTNQTSISGAISSLNDYDGSDTTGVTTLLARLTSTRAALIDALDAPSDFKADVSGLATAAALATVDGIVDAIKAKTDYLPDSTATSAIAEAVVMFDGSTASGTIPLYSLLAAAMAILRSEVTESSRVIKNPDATGTTLATQSITVNGDSQITSIGD